jgi:hypothetical protein
MTCVCEEEYDERHGEVESIFQAWGTDWIQDDAYNAVELRMSDGRMQPTNIREELRVYIVEIETIEFKVL